MRREPKLTVVVDHDDDPALRDELSRRADPPAGMVLVRPVPGVNTLVELAADVLIGLGKRFDALAREKKRPQAWPLVELWLRAERTEHLVVVDAERLSPTLWSALAGLVGTTRTNLWLVVSMGVPSANQWQAADQAQRMGGADLFAALPTSIVAGGEAEEITGPLPNDDFLTFRASCRDLLTPKHFEVVDRRYQEAFTATAGLTSWWSPSADLPSEEEVWSHLRALTASCQGPADTLVRLRAAQAAFFAAGMLVNLIPRFPASPLIPTVGLTTRVATRLRQLVSPVLCASYAIKAAYPEIEPARLTLRALSCDGATMTAGNRTLACPDYGQGLLGVQQLDRLRAGAGPDDALFVNARGTPAQPAIVRRSIARASELAGVGDPLDEPHPLWHGPFLWGWNVSATDISPLRKDFDDACQRARSG